MFRTPLAALCAGLFAVPAAAANGAPLQLALLDPIVVTATRTAQSADESLASVTVIERQDIEASQAHSVDELLRTAGDIDLSRNGGYGKSSAVFLRGTNGDHVLVLIDGVRAASATLGEFAWANLSPDQIERIEIVRGPRAALYGSDAVGGVVQIFTRQAGAPYVRLGLGSHATRELSAGLGGKLGEAWRYNLAAGHFRTDGMPTNAAFTSRHGYDNSHVSASLDGTLTPDLKLALKLSHAQGHSEQDPDTGNEDFRNQVFSASLSQKISQRWSQRLNLGQAIDDYTIHSPYTPANITTRRQSLAWQHDLQLGDDALTSLGLDAWRDQADKDQSGTIHQRLDTVALYAQQQWRMLGSDWLLGLRGDHHELSGHKVTGSLAWGRDLGEHTRLNASFGTAFKAPTVNDLYWPYSSDVYAGTTYITQGNPGLRPESSQSYELGLRQKIAAGLELRASLYRTRIKDLIEWQGSLTGPNQFTWQPSNVSRARIDGLDLNLAGEVAGWKFDGNATWLAATNQATGQQLDRRPQRKLGLRLGHDLLGGRGQLEVIAASPRNDQSGSVKLAGYGLLNLSYARPLGHGLEVQARVENLLDQHYVLASSFSGDYNTLGRSLFLSLRYQAR